MERSGHSQPDDNAGSFRTQQTHVPGTAKHQRHQQPAVSCHQAPCKSPPPHQQVSPELQALAIVYKMMLVQQDYFRIMATISGSSAAWDAIYNDRFAEEDARLKAECQRLLGFQQNTTGSHSSPVSAVHLTEHTTGDFLQAERGRRPHPVEQQSTVAHDRRSRSAEGGHPQPQLITKADVAVDAEIPDQLISKQSPVDMSSITIGSIDDVTYTAGDSQQETSTEVAQAVSLCSGNSRSLTMARSDKSIITGRLKHATSSRTPAAWRGCLPSSCSTHTVKTNRSHRLLLRPKTRWKSINTAESIAEQQTLCCVFTCVHYTTPAEQSINIPQKTSSVPVGPAATLFFNYHHHLQHLHVQITINDTSPRRSSLTRRPPE